MGVAAFLRNAPKEKPLCLYTALGYPHPPYAVEDPWYSMINRECIPPRIPTPENWDRKPSLLKGIYERQQMQTWTEERWAELRATYYGMSARVDHQLGLLVDALRETEMYEEAALFFFSNHGDFTGDYGLVEKTQNTFEGCLTRVPLVVKPPVGVPVKPGIRDTLVELVDFPAMVEALTGIAPNHTYFCRSLLPLLAVETDFHHDAAFCEGGRLHGERHCTEGDAPPDPDEPYGPRFGLQWNEGPVHTKASAQLQQRVLRFFVETADVVPHDTDNRQPWFW